MVYFGCHFWIVKTKQLVIILDLQYAHIVKEYSSQISTLMAQLLKSFSSWMSDPHIKCHLCTGPSSDCSCIWIQSCLSFLRKSFNFPQKPMWNYVMWRWTYQISNLHKNLTLCKEPHQIHLHNIKFHSSFRTIELWGSANQSALLAMCVAVLL